MAKLLSGVSMNQHNESAKTPGRNDAMTHRMITPFAPLRLCVKLGIYNSNKMMVWARATNKQDALYTIFLPQRSFTIRAILGFLNCLYTAMSLGYPMKGLMEPPSMLATQILTPASSVATPFSWK